MHGIDQHQGLGGGSRAQLDQLVGPDAGHQTFGVLGEDLGLGLGQVVLRQPGDFFEELRAAGIVEILGRQVLAVCGETVAHVFEKLISIVGGFGQPGHGDRRIAFCSHAAAPSCSMGRMSIPLVVRTASECSGIDAHPASSSSGSDASQLPSAVVRV